MGHHRAIQILLEKSASPDVERLAQGAPKGTFLWEPKTAVLRVEFDPAEVAVVAITAAVLPELVTQGCGILEVRRGGGLEQEYLKRPEA